MVRYSVFGWKRHGKGLRNKQEYSESREAALRKAEKLTAKGFRVSVCNLNRGICEVYPIIEGRKI